MSREIKFRAWNDDEMILGVGLDPSCIPYRILNEGDSYENFIYYPEGKLMQYTGLKDKNGVEIYEGDILCLKNSKAQMVNHQEVYWNSEAASFDWRTANDNSWPDGFTGFYDEYEVIGNIHENPELLR